MRRIGADGFPVNPGVQTLSVTNLTAGGSFGTVVSDANGVITGGTFSATIGDVAEFSHATYPETFRITLAETEDLAYLRRAGTPTAAYILENLYTATVNSDRVQFYAQDLDNMGQRPILLGEGYVGTTYVPYQSNLPKRLRIFPMSFTDESDMVRAHFDTTNYEDIDIPAIGGRSLFDHFTDATTTGTVEETLWIDQFDAGLFAVNGDAVEVDEAGSYAANANDKSLYLYLGAGSFYGVTVNENDTHWWIHLSLTRKNNTTLKFFALFKSAAAWEPTVGEITGLDLDATDYDLKLTGETPSAAGDVIAKIGHGRFYPAATTNMGWLLDENGEPILDEDGDQIEGE